MSNELAAQTQLPPHIAALAKNDKEHVDAFGVLEATDFALNFIKFVHRMSKEAIAGWGPTKQEPAMPLNSMFLSRTHNPIPIGTPFIPLCRRVTYIKWIGRPGEGRMAFMATKKDDPRIVEINGLEFPTDPETKKLMPPPVTQYINYYVMVKGLTDEPAVLSFYRTSYPIGKRFTQDLFTATKGGTLPMYAFQYKFGAPIMKRDGENEHPQFVLQPAGCTEEKAIKHAEKLFELAQAFASSSTGAEFTMLDDEPAETPGTGTLKQVHAAPVVQSPAPPPAVQSQVAIPAPTKTETASVPVQNNSQPEVAPNEPATALW